MILSVLSRTIRIIDGILGLVTFSTIPLDLIGLGLISLGEDSFANNVPVIGGGRQTVALPSRALSPSAGQRGAMRARRARPANVSVIPLFVARSTLADAELPQGEALIEQAERAGYVDEFETRYVARQSPDWNIDGQPPVR